MKIGVPKETRSGEFRVAVTPESIKKSPKGCEFLIERGAGAASNFTDEMYAVAGARIVEREDAFSAEIVLKVRPPQENEAGLLRGGALLISMIEPFGEGPALMERLAAAKVNVIGMELIPRITRAQPMDVLSSQANIAGYKAVVEAAHHFGKLFPMMMTAAGSVPPAKVFVLGVGVAGLQAIVTARKLGAQVEAFDVRPEVREQIQSVGAKFLELGLEESGSGEGGYAKELTKESQELQRQALGKAIPRADIVITTALIPGRPAPVLVPADAVPHMKPGSVIVDLAAANGGNCPLTEADKIVVKHNVTLIGLTNLPSMMASHSSQFYARNLASLMGILITKEGDNPAVLKLDLADEIVDAALVTNGGEKRWPKKK